VLCSFGKEALLMLALAREVLPDIPVVWFREAASTEELAIGEQFIKEWGLDVYSYQPQSVYLLARDDHIALAQEYVYGEAVIPLFANLAPGERCVLTAYPGRTYRYTPPFDLLLCGYKDRDIHWLTGGADMFPANYHWGHAKVVAPLRHMTDDEVRAALLELKIPYHPPDSRLELCTACMTAKEDRVWCHAEQAYIPRHQWDQEQALNIFHQRFGLGGH
jgi:hypothetical protein